MKKAKVLQLNCLHNQQEDRVASIISSIRAVNPDFGMLQEIKEPKTFAEELEKIGYPHSLIREFTAHNGDGESVMLFSKTPLEECDLTTSVDPKIIERTLAATTEFADKKLLLISAHSPWGSQAEGRRLRHAEAFNHIAENIGFLKEVNLTILGADLNAEPSYRSVRYLLGRDLASDGLSSTLWVDGWTSAGDATNEVTVSANKNWFAGRTARNAGAIQPNSVPDRRIDYIMTHGWNYGRSGGFASFERLDQEKRRIVSDHYGLVAEIYV